MMNMTVSQTDIVKVRRDDLYDALDVLDSVGERSLQYYQQYHRDGYERLESAAHEDAVPQTDMVMVGRDDLQRIVRAFLVECDTDPWKLQYGRALERLINAAGIQTVRWDAPGSTE